MATRVSILLFLSTVGLVAYAAALLFTSATLHWLGMAVGLPDTDHFQANALLRELLPAIAFQISLFIVYAALPYRLTQIVGSRLRQAIVNATLIAILATVLWLGMLYAAGGLANVMRLFVVVLAMSTGALLIGFLWFLRVRGPAEALGIVLASALVYGAPPTGPDHALVISGYPLAIALGYGLVFRHFGAPMSLLSQIATLFVAVVGAHLIWVGGLFLAGAVPALPVWLALASAALFLAFGIALPIGVRCLRGRGALYGLLYDTTREPDPKLEPEVIWPSTGSEVPAGKRAWIISYTGVSNEPRVLRQCEALLSDGWQVVVCGFDGHSQRPPEWTFVRLPQSYPFPSALTETLARTGRWARQALHYSGNTPLTRWLAHIAHASTPLWLHIRLTLLDLAKAHPELKADLVIAHDYHTSDVGYALARHYGAAFSIDVHEYAREQYSNDPEWVKWQRPTIIAVQDEYLRHSDVTTVVCEGIADLLAKECPLKKPPIVIRNVPFKNTQPFRKASEQITVLYHGDLSKPRDIDVAIASVPLWRPEFRLLLRGSGHADYVASLHQKIEQLGLHDRVKIVPPVPFHSIVEAANESDIGFFSYTSYSPQIQFALPNKIFEYIMAGLAICVTDLTEVSRIVDRCRNGYLITRHSPEGIAEAINRFDRETIDTFKRASIAASEELNWETERERLLRAYRRALR